MFRQIRIVSLLFILLLLAVGSWQDRWRLASWELPLRVVLYPIAGDESAATRRHVDGLGAETFQPIVSFLEEEARSFGIVPGYGPLLKVRLAPEVASLPPAPPLGGNVVSIAIWSLRLRWWAWSVDRYDGLSPDVRLFLVYHAPSTEGALEHSLGLAKGRIGVAHVLASRAMDGANNVVIAHELLHTLGATDKYDPRTDQPLYPDGYAKPEATPRYPQRYAEIMAGRIPLSPTDSVVPASLNVAVVGAVTAREIHWTH